MGAQRPTGGPHTAKSGVGREAATTSGAPHPPAHTQSDGPQRRAPRVPDADPGMTLRKGDEDAGSTDVHGDPRQ